jgi:hypothetical protein
LLSEMFELLPVSVVVQLADHLAILISGPP